MSKILRPDTISVLNDELKEKIIAAHRKRPQTRLDNLARRFHTTGAIVREALVDLVEVGNPGRISRLDQKTIRQMLLDGKTDSEIALVVQKGIHVIAKYRTNLQLDQFSNKPPEYLALLNKLINKQYWKSIKQVLTDEELEIFQENWIEIMIQFKEDLLPTEELQLKEVLITDILILRSLVERRGAVKEIEGYVKQISDIYALPPDERDSMRLEWLLNQKMALEAAQKVSTSEQIKLGERMKHLMSDLKATRNQRLKQVTDGKTSWSGLLRYFEEERNRVKEGLSAEIQKKAMELEFERMSAPHSYIDNSVDLPFLSAESLEIYDKVEETKED